jgi:hypothetical protein
MQVDGEHKLQPFPDHIRAPFAFPVSPHFPSLLFLPESPVFSGRRRGAHAPSGRSMAIGDMPGQHRGPLTRSAFFCRDIGGETQGIQRFQLLEGVE